jgi:hypothetical protein
MTIQNLLEQFEKEFPGDIITMEEDGNHARIATTYYNLTRIKNWLRTHFTEMVKEAIELNKGISSQGYCTKRNENKTLDANLCVDIEQAVTHGLLQTLGIEK